MSFPIQSPRPTGTLTIAAINKSVGRIVCADGTLCLQVIQFLRIAGAETGGDKRVCTRGRIVDGLGERVVPFEADVLAWPLLETYLQRIVIGAGLQQGEPAKWAIKLRIGAQDIDHGNLVIVINGFRFVESGVRTVEEWQERIVYQASDGRRCNAVGLSGVQLRPRYVATQSDCESKKVKSCGSRCQSKN